MSPIPPWGIVFSYCPRCEEERLEAEAAEKTRALQARLTHDIPPHYRDADLRQFDPAVIAPVLKWAEEPTGFLYVTGKVGAGKTHLACAVKKKLNAAGRGSSLVFSADMFLALYKSFNSKKNAEADEEAIIKKYAPDSGGDIAIFDDVGAQKVSDYTTDVWYKIIDRRYRNNYPTMFTTNLSPEELDRRLGDRIISRIISGVVFEFPGEDRRLQRAKNWVAEKFD
jgi:DNA replication protein DnaC